VTLLLTCGVDISTTRIDVAAVPLNLADQPMLPDMPDPQPYLLACGRVKQGGGDAPRAQRAGDTLYRLLRGLEDAYGGQVASVALETPFAKFIKSVTALLPILGACTMACRPVCGDAVTWYRPQEWRKALGAKGKAVTSKDGGHEQVALHVRAMLPDAPDARRVHDEHELDALGVALVWRMAQKA
jgi:Holliday junction resolvasome RuvABC endonuclease subunit